MSTITFNHATPAIEVDGVEFTDKGVWCWDVTKPSTELFIPYASILALGRPNRRK